jgi:hypothetical protein
MKRFHLIICIVVFAILALALGAEYTMKQFEQDMYLKQIENEAGMARSYARILKNPTKTSEEKLRLLSQLSDTHISALTNQIALVFPAHHRELPEVWKELSAAK